MTRRWDLIERVATRLESAGVPTPEVDARWIVDELAERFGGDLDACDGAVLDALVERRAAREPLQLILGSTSFRHVTVVCEPGVFLPRPETEVVAGAAIDVASTIRGPAIVVDLCTGTGAIALALASELANGTIIATDREARAVDLATRNARALAERLAPTPWTVGDHLAPGTTIEVLRGDLFSSIPSTLASRVDVIVSNPPYLPLADRASWEPEVSDHDPLDALVGGADGHEVVNAILGQSQDWLRPGGAVIVEIDERRSADAIRAARDVGLERVAVISDLAGRDRALVAHRPEVAA